MKEMEMKWKWKWLIMWMMILVMVGFLCDGYCWDDEKIALLQLKSSFSHIHDVYNWGLGNQNFSSDCCQWPRVECNSSSGRVTRLFLNLTSTFITTYISRDLIFYEYVYDYNYDDDYYYAYSDYYDHSTMMDNWYLNASLFLPFKELNGLNLSGNSIAGCVHNQGFEKLSSKFNKLEILDLSLNNFNDSILPFLSELLSLKSLNLGGNQLSGSNPTNGFKQLSKLNKLENLNLYGNKRLGNNILSQLDGFTSLKSLRLQDCGLQGSVDMLGEFKYLRSLKELYLGENQIDTLGPLYQGTNNSSTNKLEVLGLSDNLFNTSIFSSLAVLQNLKSLYIDWNNLEGSIHIKHLNALSNLEILTMNSNEVNEFAPSEENETELRLINLELLDLGGNPFNESVLSSLGRLSNLKSLYIDLEGSTNLKVLNALSLETLSIYCQGGQGIYYGLTSLKTLELIGCSFTKTMTTQNLWQTFSSLETLSLDSSSLPSNFIQDLGALTSLKDLHISSCEVNGSLFIDGPLQLKNMESLTITSTSLDTNFLQNIGGMPFLKSITLQKCGLNGTLNTQGICELMNLHTLDVSFNKLKDNIPDCFSNLTSLQSLDLSSNQFSGNISFLESLTSLTTLDLSFNQFSGNISFLESLTSLTTLDLSSNQFSGNISFLESLTSLQQLDLSNNNFQIPSSLGPLFNLSNLQFIHANNNTIYAEPEMHSLAPTFQLKQISLSCCGDAGSFPQFLYHQRDLRYVDLSNIKFIDVFPNWLLQNNTNLHLLALSNNSLLGPFYLPSLPHSELYDLHISKNSFCGHIPTEIGVKLPSLKTLNMSENSFDGSIPDSIGDIRSLEVLDLSANKLFGDLPVHLAMGCSLLTTLVLSNNKLQGQMFSSNFSLTKLEHLGLEGNHFSGKIPDCLSNCSALSTLHVGNNQLVGEIPRWMGNMSSLDEIFMANNHLEGPIPVEFCQLNLKLLDLSKNNITGGVPSCFSPLHIRQVHLSKNKLQGPLTNAFRNSTFLVTLDLSSNHLTGNIPDWIGRLSQLSYLLLNNNRFQGAIPVELCMLGNLSLINLSNNNLSGTIPPCLKITTTNNIYQDNYRYYGFPVLDMSFPVDEPIEFTTKNNSYSYKGRILALLSGIDLSCNWLTGEIPHEVKNFQKIFALNLSHNSLTGAIPLALSDLKQIESLDLSHNKLSGKIPPQLVRLNFLSYFSVAYNNLSGSTPEWTAQFTTFEKSSYEGNALLCGKPLPTCSLPSGPSSPTLPKASTEDGIIDMDVFYVSFFVAYGMVLLTIAIILYINPYWRRAWFYYIEVGITASYYFVIDNILPKRFRY